MIVLSTYHERKDVCLHPWFFRSTNSINRTNFAVATMIRISRNIYLCYGNACSFFASSITWWYRVFPVIPVTRRAVSVAVPVYSRTWCILTGLMTHLWSRNNKSVSRSWNLLTHIVISPPDAIGEFFAYHCKLQKSADFRDLWDGRRPSFRGIIETESYNLLRYRSRFCNDLVKRPPKDLKL